jgi:hypothetical protein
LRLMIEFFTIWHTVMREEAHRQLCSICTLLPNCASNAQQKA